MSAEGDTLHAAPAQADTVSTEAAPSVESAPSTTEPAPVQTDTADATAAPERLWAGKYKAPEVMEEGYLDLQRRFTMETQRNAELQRQAQAAQATPVAPKYSKEQLMGAKIDFLNKMTEARYNGDATEAQKCASHVAWCDEQLMDQRVQGVQTEARRQSAEQTMMTEMLGVVQRYQAELVPGTPLYEKAAQLLGQYEAMGMGNNALTQAHAVTMAAHLLGKVQSQTEQTTRRELTKTINQQLKSGVVAGAGHAVASSNAQPDFLNMPKAEFDAWTRANVR